MLNLKTELYKKQKEVKDLQSHSSTHKTSVVKAASSSGKKKGPSWLKKNSGVEKRNENDLLEVKEDEKHTQVQAILEAKSKLYDKMTKGDFIPDSEDTQEFLVDFEQKSIDAWRERHEKGDEIVKPKLNVKVTSEVKKTIDDVKDQWVDYVDDFGRTRTVLKEDLPRLEKQKSRTTASESSEAKTLMSDDMRREEGRLNWEKSAIEEMQNEVHYENLRFGEIRELGVGYYSFSGQQAEREEQMKRLDQYRKETEKRKQENEMKKQKQQNALTARLEKVRQRKIKQLKALGKEIPASLLEPIKIEEPKQKTLEEVKPVDYAEVIIENPDPVSNKTREWDKGKDVWEPAKPPTAPKSWNDPREDRPSEFAPPDFYYSSSNKTDSGPPRKQAKVEDTPKEQNTDTERIQRLLAEISSSETKAADSNEKSPPTCDSESVPVSEPAPYIPANKPISMKLMSKPTKLLNVKSTVEL